MGNARQPLEIHPQRIRRSAGHDEFGLFGLCQLLDAVVIQHFVGVQTILVKVVEFARSVHRSTVRQVATFGKAHAKHGIAGLENGHVDRLVGLGSRIRLHVGSLGAKQCLEPVDRELLDDIHVLAATVIPLPRIAFSVLVGHLRALGLHDGRAGVVFGGDQLDVLFLPFVFLLNGCPDLGVDTVKGEGSIKHEFS